MSSSIGNKSGEPSCESLDLDEVDNANENDPRPEQLREASAVDFSFLSSRPGSRDVLNFGPRNKQQLQRSPAVDALDELLGKSSKCLVPNNGSLVSSSNESISFCDNETISYSEELFSSTMVKGGDSKKLKMVDISFIEARESVDCRLSCQHVLRTKFPLSSSQGRVTNDLDRSCEVDTENRNNYTVAQNESTKQFNDEVNIENGKNVEVTSNESTKHEVDYYSSNALKPIDQSIGGGTDIIARSMSMVSASAQSEDHISSCEATQKEVSISAYSDVIVNGDDSIELSGKKPTPLEEVNGDKKNKVPVEVNAIEVSENLRTKMSNNIYSKTRLFNMDLVDSEGTSSEIAVVHNPGISVPHKQISYIPNSLRGKKITRKLKLLHPIRVPASKTFHFFSPAEYYKGKPRSERLFDEFIEEKDVVHRDSLFS